MGRVIALLLCAALAGVAALPAANQYYPTPPGAGQFNPQAGMLPWNMQQMAFPGPPSPIANFGQGQFAQQPNMPAMPAQQFGPQDPFAAMFGQNYGPMQPVQAPMNPQNPATQFGGFGGQFPFNMGTLQGMQPNPAPNQPTQPQYFNPGNMFGGLFGGNPMAQPPPATPPARSAQKQDYMWVCLEQVFPPELRIGAGIPDKVLSILDNYVMHASVLIGPNVDQSTGFQRQLNEGAMYWNDVLSSLKHVDTDNPVEWAKSKMSQVRGTNRFSSTAGVNLFQNSERCYRTHEPVHCNAHDLQAFTDYYSSKHPNFNLFNDNCQVYACAALEHCARPAGSDPASSADEEALMQQDSAPQDTTPAIAEPSLPALAGHTAPHPSTCDAKTCFKQLMWQPLSSKTPGCDSELAHAKKPGERVGLLGTMTGVLEALGKGSPVEALLGKLMGTALVSEDGAVQRKSLGLPEELRGFFPMHYPDAWDLSRESEADNTGAL